MSKRKDFYIYEQFNVRCFTASPMSMVRNIATRLVNAFIKALNDYNFLPHMVLIILDLDLENTVREDGYTFHVMLEKLLAWVITTVERSVQSKKDMLLCRKPGAVTSSKPKIIWVTAICRFNSILNKLLLNKRGTYLLDINKSLNVDKNLFTAFGDLTAAGRIAYWTEIDKIVKKFDYKLISLKPIKEDRHSPKPDNRTCYKMPPPPPSRGGGAVRIPGRSQFVQETYHHHHLQQQKSRKIINC